MKKTIFTLIFLIAIAGGVFYFVRPAFEKKPHSLVLYGNADDRQVNLSFSIQERIAELLPEEGDLVKKGDLVGKLETVRLNNDAAAAAAQIPVRQAVLKAATALYEKAKNGSRKEDIAISKYISEAITAKIKAAESDFHRKQTLVDSDAVSKQSGETAEAEYFFLKAALEGSKTMVERLTSGERPEDIAAAAARVREAEASVALAKAELAIREQKVKDTELFAPCDGIVRSRLREPGEMATPQTPVLTITMISPKWIRCYINESNLVKIKPGDKAEVKFDGAEEPFEGQVGFISPNAEFTPKNIETSDLRTNLVYEVRVIVKDPDNRLRSGAPATVTFPEIMATE